jgi:hypothetical protein
VLSCAKRVAGVKKGCIVLSIYKKTALATVMLVVSVSSGLVACIGTPDYDMYQMVYPYGNGQAKPNWVSDSNPYSCKESFVPVVLTLDHSSYGVNDNPEGINVSVEIHGDTHHTHVVQKSYKGNPVGSIVLKNPDKANPSSSEEEVIYYEMPRNVIDGNIRLNGAYHNLRSLTICY